MNYLVFVFLLLLVSLRSADISNIIMIHAYCLKNHVNVSVFVELFNITNHDDSVLLKVISPL